MGARRGIVLLLALSACLTGCGGHRHASATTRRTAKVAEPARLTGAHPCPGPGESGFTCATLHVPRDHAGQAGGTLALAVGMDSARVAPRGILLFLTGGPGQPGVSFLNRIHTALGTELAGYRLVMFDQRGTGAGALDCPALQQAAGASDLTVVRPAVVTACARSIGAARRYYSTSETVADIDDLRTALGAQQLTLDGV